jgi:hypothetical protein
MRIVILFIIAAIISSCSNDGDKFLGTWVNVESSWPETIKVSKNGVDYLVEYNLKAPKSVFGINDSKSWKMVATVNGTSLKLNELTNISLINNGTTLLFNNEEYTNQKEIERLEKEKRESALKAAAKITGTWTFHHRLYNGQVSQPSELRAVPQDFPDIEIKANPDGTIKIEELRNDGRQSTYLDVRLIDGKLMFTEKFIMEDHYDTVEGKYFELSDGALLRLTSKYDKGKDGDYYSKK